MLSLAALRHSIRFRLLLTVGAVVAVSLVAVGVATTRITRRELQRFTAIALRVRDGAKVPEPTVTAPSRPSSQDVSGAVSTAMGEACAPNARENPRVVVLNGTGEGVTEVLPDLLRVLPTQCPLPSVGPGLQPSNTVIGVGAPLSDRIGRPAASPGSAPAEAISVLAAEARAASEQRRQLMRSVERRTLGTVLLAGVAALAATAVLARRMLRPVEELTGIAREMASGNLGRRASASSRDEIGELGRTFNAMADGLERIEELRRRMVHDVAHELRTPLTNIRAHLEAVQDGLLAPSPEVVDSLHEEALALQRLVDDLQELALAEAGQLRIEPCAVEVREAVERVVKPLAVAARGAVIEVAVPQALRVLADPDRLAQVLRNLVANALAHTPPGGWVHVCARELAEDGRRMVELRVSDTGPGIAAADLPHVFERFYRGDRSRSRATGGAGLGLAITRRLVEAHGGRISAESPPGEGATLRFTLPAAEWTECPSR